MELTHKICNKCNINKEVSCFRKHKSYKYGLLSRCKECEYKYRDIEKNKQNNRNYKAKNREKNNQYNKLHRERTKLIEKNPPDFKKCARCKKDKHQLEFLRVPTSASGLGSKCKECRSIAQKNKYYSDKSKQRTYHHTRRNRTPKWADLNKIKDFYNNCPAGYAVDHIIPLKGKLVCGLHVENNLQYLTRKENSSKNNKFDPYIEIY